MHLGIRKCYMAGMRTEGQRLLRDWLESTGKSQRDLARGLKRSDPTVSMWVRGLYLPDVEGAGELERFTDGAIPANAWSRRPQRKRRSA